MAYTCDKCGKSDLPDSNAFLQHLSICPAFRKAQEELEASRARRTEIYRVRELTEQKESPDTAKKPVIQQVERRREVEGSVGDEFQCPKCFGTFSKKANLIRHLKEAKSCKRKVSADEIKDIRENAPKDPSSECPHCGAVVSKSVMSRHINVNCPARKSAKPQARAHRLDLNVSRDSLVDRAENLDIIETPVISDVAAVELDEGDLKADRGGRFFFTSDERKIVQTAFLFALDSDGNRKASITSYIGTQNGQKSDFHKAYEGDKVFKEMVDRIMEEQEFEMAEIKKKIMETYRNFYRNPGNSSASTSGAGKAKALKPKSSKKDPTKSPAKKKNRWVEESDSEEEDSPEFSEESSE